MKWLNIELKVLRSHEYLGSEPTERATWINLMSYCADHENGGIIKSCSGWGDRKWMQLVGITAEEINTGSDLWKMKDENCIVKYYPKTQEKKVKCNRVNGAKGGRPVKGDKPSGKPDGKPSGYPSGSASLKRNSNSNSNSKGKSNSKSNNKKHKEVVIFPHDWMKLDKFQESWKEWNQHRKEIKKPQTYGSIKQQLNKLGELGEIESVRWINNAIMQGWQGLYEPASKPTTTQPTETEPVDLDAMI